MPFEDIGPIVGRSPDAARQLAPSAGTVHQREVVDAFLRAARAGDIEGFLAVLDPDGVIHIEAAARIDAPAAEAGQPRELRGASTWVRQFVALSRGLRSVQPALVNGSVGVVLAPRGQPSRALAFTFTNDRVARIEVIADPARLRELDIAALSQPR